ncbi:MAG: hypothetical protein KA066_01795 [Candidatus Pacebacteria bacterium]|nr:hypothetical protein [Candidatus Paceibacterota bacterium]
MTTNPFLNALGAVGYIVAVVVVMYYGGPLMGGPDGEDTVFIPMAMLSLFVFSAATMAYIVLYQPMVMFLEDKKVEAVNLFLKTIGALGIFMVVLFALQFVFSR